MKKAVSLLLAVVTAVGMLTSCAGNSSSATAGKAGSSAVPASSSGSSTVTSGKSSRTKISVLLRSSGSDETYKIWHGLFDGYAKEKGLKVEYETIAGDSDYVNKLQLYISSNQLPDFYGCANGTFSEAAKKIGGIVNVGDELKKIGKYDSMNKAVINFLTDAKDGNMYLYPNALYCEFFWYRKDKFEKYGLSAPKTWDDFLNDCKVLKAHGEIPTIVAGSENWQLMRYLSFIPWRATDDKFIKGYIDGSDSFSKNAAAKAGVNLLATMGKDGYFQNGFTSTSYTDATNLFFGGQGCIFYSGSGHIANASKMYADRQLGMFAVPDAAGMTNMPTNIPVHAGFGNAFNAKTYDATMQDFFKYAVDHYTTSCYSAGVFSPFNDPVPSGLDKLFTDIQPMFKNATASWVSWDDKLDSATLTSMAQAQQELALGMLSQDKFITQMDATIKANTSK